MGSNWPLVKLCDYADFQEGYVNPTQKKPEYFDGPVKWLRAVDLNDGFVYKTSRTLSLQGFESAGKSAKLFEPGTLAISKSGTIGRIGILKDYMCGNRAVINVKPHKDTLDTWFAFYILKYRRPDVEQLAIGSVQPNLYTSALGSLQFHLPPLHIQHSISSLLSSIDKKIESNRQISQTLEQMAQALFKSWFVDFDPVVDNALDAGFFELKLAFPDELLRRAEARKAVRENSGLKPLPEDIRQLFPAAFEECTEPSLGLGGWVPKGWANIAIYSLAEFINGAAYKAFEPNLEQRGLPIIKIAELKAGITAQTAFSDREMPDKYRLSTGDILFSWSGNPDTSIDTFVWTYGDALLNQHIFKVTPPDDLGERSFILIALKSLRQVFAETARNKQTTGLGHVTVADLKRLQIVKPEPNVLAAWDSLVSPYVNQSLSLTLQAQTLSNLRDTLLPKLISGELRLDKIEADIAEEGAA